MGPHISDQPSPRDHEEYDGLVDSRLVVKYFETKRSDDGNPSFLVEDAGRRCPLVSRSRGGEEGGPAVFVDDIR